MNYPNGRIKIRLPNRLSIRLAFALIMIAISSVLGLALMQYQAERQVLKDQLIRQLTSVVTLKEQEIEVWLTERRADVRMLAINKLNQDHVTVVTSAETTPEKREEFVAFLNDNLFSMQQSRRGYLEATIVGVDGVVLAASDPALIGEKTAHDIAFAQTLASENHEYIQDIHHDPNTNLVGMAFGHSIIGVDVQTGQEISSIVGVVLIIVDMEATIYPLISAWPGLGESGETLLVRADGENTLFLNNLRFDDDAALNLRVPVSSPNAMPAYLASGGDEGVIETPDYRGVPVVAAYRHIDQIGWGLVAKQNVEELFIPIKELGYRTIFYMSITLLMVGVVAIFLSQNLTGPLRNLVQAADQIAADDLYMPSPSKRNDEIGLLTEAFRTMVGSLQQRRRQSETATFILRQLNTTSNVHEVIDGVLAAIKQSTNCESICILTLEPAEARYAIAAVSQPRPGFTRGSSITMKSAAFTEDLLAGQTHVSPALADEDSHELEKKLFALGYRSRLTVPLSINKVIVGALNLVWRSEDGYKPTQIEWLEQVADTIALAFERSRLFSEMNEKIEERTRELASANQRLQHLDKLKSKFVSDVSHELRTPVANLKLYLQLMQRGGDEAKQRHYRDVLDSQANRLDQLIADILDLSRLETEHEKVQFAPVDINLLIEQVVESQRATAEHKGLLLSTELDQTIDSICGERNQLRQVLTNLVANAINYTPAGEVLVRTIITSEIDDVVIVEVTDSGMGIEPDDLPYLFDRFYRGQRKSGPDIPGTGLGLGIAKEIVEAHGGDILVESILGEGSTFRVTFPMTQPALAAVH